MSVLRPKCVPLVAMILALGLAALPAGPAPAPASQPRLNVLLVTIDTLRADRVGAYGSKRGLTPNLDRLAARSSVFTRAFAHTVVTLPSHTNILLGTTPSTHGVHDNLNFVVREEHLTLAEHLGARGYATAAFIGGFPLDSYFGLDQGFSTYDDSFAKPETGVRAADAKGGERPAGEVWANARRWLRGRQQPWFLWVHFYDPHDPYAPPEPYRTKYAGAPYDGEIAYADAVLGDILKEIEGQGLDGSTLIVCVSDHGEGLGDHGEATHGYLAYNPTLWIPLMVRLPGLPPRVIGQNVSHIDIFPTVCDAVGIDSPKALQGASLLPLMRGRRLADRPIYFEALSAYYNMGWAPLRGLIDGRYKYIDTPSPELYDLERDFGETSDLGGQGGLEPWRRRVDSVVRSQTSPEGARAGQAADRATLEKLRSLGYVGGPPGPKRSDFGPEDAPGALLPYHNRAAEAFKLYQAGKAAEAIWTLREVLTARRNVSTAYLNLASIYKAEGRPADAIAVLRLGREALPENYDIHFQYLVDLYESGRYDDVLQAFGERSFSQVEFDPVVWNCLGLTYWRKGDVPEALACFDQSLAIDEEFAVTFHNRGTVHFDVFQKTRDPGSLNLALADFDKAAALDPAYGPAFHSLGVAAFQAGDFAKAIESLDKALALDPGLDEAHFFLGSAHLKLGHRAQAFDHLTKYKASPTYGRLSPAAQKRLDELIAACRPGR
jgi:arylsulfatase A-like enzyme/tetratricopeptide (TPR) repeat protein